MPATTGVKLVSSGCRILSKEEVTSSKPMRMISRETNRPVRYSILPCPKGCPGSGFCPAILKPTSVIREEPASERLLKASAVMAMELLRSPAKNFPRKSTAFRPIPTAPQSTP